MPDIKFFIESAAAHPTAVVPTLMLGLRVVNATPEPVHSMLIRAQVHIEPARRTYDAREVERLEALFAAPERWDQTLRPLYWQQVTMMVAGFTGTTAAPLPLACSQQLERGADRYCRSLDSESAIPLRVFFSGTVFYEGERGVQAMPLAWNLEASHRVPQSCWRACFAPLALPSLVQAA